MVINMTSRIYRSLLTVGLTLLISFTVVFGIPINNSWASASFTPIASIERVKAGAKALEGKTQEAIGNLTGDRKDQMVGKAKQVESKTRNLIEDAKDKVQELFE